MAKKKGKAAKRQPKDRKRQIGYVFTYLWALIIILVVFGAIAYFGFFNAQRYARDRCTMQAGIECTGYAVTPNHVVLSLTNMMGQSITIEEITITDNLGEETCKSSITKTIADDEENLYSLADCSTGEVGENFKATISITMKDAQGAERTRTGEIVTRIN